MPFYHLVGHLAVFDIAQILAHIIALPLFITGEPLYGMGLAHNTYTLLQQIGWTGLLYTSFLIALNRFCVFVFGSHSMITMFLFEEHIRITTLIPYVVGVVTHLSSTWYGCLLLFSHTQLRVVYVCADASGWAFLGASFTVEMAVPVLMMVMYMVVFATLVANRRRHLLNQDAMAKRRMKTERGLLLQAALICGMLELAKVGFVKMGAGVLGGIIATCIGLLNNSINPYIYLVFNGSVKASVRTVLGLGTPVVAIAPAAQNP